ncbi:MAG: radical SAM family heme chaperone HemW [Clostridia bacterium]|nr:radical SAM family heme chaperone HemW [Clostridia bacterium]
MKKAGLYIHIPFCSSKCPYCDFYSVKFDEQSADKYTSAVIKKLSKYHDIEVQTIYFGGGTPGILGTERILQIMDAIKRNFAIKHNCEVTLELNPESAGKLDFAMLYQNGINRLSMGLQSSNDKELKYLGRLHSAKMLEQTVKDAKSAGFENISLDLILGVPKQTIEGLNHSIEYCASLDVTHISAYILKIEENTPFYTHADKFEFPDEDMQSELYLFAVKRLAELGYEQYEISNFCKPGYQSQHNNLYWLCEEYIGVGPSAHSFFEGKRFYYPRSFEDFYEDIIIEDGVGGDEEEFCMLRLRLKKGLSNKDFYNRFGKNLPNQYFTNAKRLTGYVECDDECISLTTQGFLLSNYIISEILY